MYNLKGKTICICLVTDSKKQIGLNADDIEGYVFATLGERTQIFEVDAKTLEVRGVKDVHNLTIGTNGKIKSAMYSFDKFARRNSKGVYFRQGMIVLCEPDVGTENYYLMDGKGKVYAVSEDMLKKHLVSASVGSSSDNYVVNMGITKTATGYNLKWVDSVYSAQESSKDASDSVARSVLSSLGGKPYYLGENGTLDCSNYGKESGSYRKEETLDLSSYGKVKRLAKGAYFKGIKNLTLNKEFEEIERDTLGLLNGESFDISRCENLRRIDEYSLTLCIKDDNFGDKSFEGGVLRLPASLEYIGRQGLSVVSRVGAAVKAVVEVPIHTKLETNAVNCAVRRYVVDDSYGRYSWGEDLLGSDGSGQEFLTGNRLHEAVKRAWKLELGFSARSRGHLMLVPLYDCGGDKVLVYAHNVQKLVVLNLKQLSKYNLYGLDEGLEVIFGSIKDDSTGKVSSDIYLKDSAGAVYKLPILPSIVGKTGKAKKVKSKVLGDLGGDLIYGDLSARQSAAIKDYYLSYSIFEVERIKGNSLDFVVPNEKKLVLADLRGDRDWVYGGYVDLGGVTGKCTLGHKLRYKHFAIPKVEGESTWERLRRARSLPEEEKIGFGLSCVSDFFSISAEGIKELEAISTTVRDELEFIVAMSADYGLLKKAEADASFELLNLMLESFSKEQLESMTTRPYLVEFLLKFKALGIVYPKSMVLGFTENLKNVLDFNFKDLRDFLERLDSQDRDFLVDLYGKNKVENSVYTMERALNLVAILSIIHGRRIMEKGLVSGVTNVNLRAFSLKLFGCFVRILFNYGVNDAQLTYHEITNVLTGTKVYDDYFVLSEAKALVGSQGKNIFGNQKRWEVVGGNAVGCALKEFLPRMVEGIYAHAPIMGELKGFPLRKEVGSYSVKAKDTYRLLKSKLKDNFVFFYERGDLRGIANTAFVGYDADSVDDVLVQLYLMECLTDRYLTYVGKLLEDGDEEEFHKVLSYLVDAILRNKGNRVFLLPDATEFSLGKEVNSLARSLYLEGDKRGEFKQAFKSVLEGYLGGTGSEDAVRFIDKHILNWSVANTLSKVDIYNLIAYAVDKGVLVFSVDAYSKIVYHRGLLPGPRFGSQFFSNRGVNLLTICGVLDMPQVEVYKQFAKVNISLLSRVINSGEEMLNYFKEERE